MSTRLYLSTAYDPVAIASFPGWHDTGLGWPTPHLAPRTPDLSALGTTSFSTEYGSGGYLDDILLGVFVFGPLKAQTISGTVKGQVRAAEGGATNDIRAQMQIRVLSADGATARGTALARDTSALSNEFATALTNRKFPKGWAGAGAALTDVAAQDGDWLVIEVGARLGASSGSFSLRFGCAGNGDLPEDEIETGDLRPWVEFSADLLPLYPSNRGIENLPLGEAQAAGPRVAIFAEAAFASGTSRVWSGIGPKSWAGQSWTGVGTLLGVGAVTETAEVEAQGTTLTLSGVPASMVSAALGQARQGAPAAIWLAFLDAGGNVIPEPYNLFRGRIDRMPIAEGPDTATVTVVLENRLIDLERARTRRYTPEDQKIDYPDDRFFDYVAGLQDATITWGRG